MSYNFQYYGHLKCMGALSNHSGLWVQDIMLSTLSGSGLNTQDCVSLGAGPGLDLSITHSEGAVQGLQTHSWHRVRLTRQHQFIEVDMCSLEFI